MKDGQDTNDIVFVILYLCYSNNNTSFTITVNVNVNTYQILRITLDIRTKEGLIEGSRSLVEGILISHNLPCTTIYVR